MNSMRPMLVGVAALALAVAVWLWVIASQAPKVTGMEPPRLARNRIANTEMPRSATAHPTPSTPHGADISAVGEPSLADLVALPPGFLRTQSLERFGFDSAVRGVDAAMRVLAEITDATDRAAFLRGMFAKLASGAPAEAFRAIQLLPVGIDRERAVASLIETWRPKPISTGAQASLTQRYGAIGGLIGRLLDDPTLAAEAARALLSGMERGRVLGTAAGRLAANDPQRALTFGSGLDGPERTEFMLNFATGWAHSAGEAAFAWSLHEQDAVLRDSLQATIVSTWALHDPQAAASYLPAITSAESRANVIKALASSWGMADTQAAFAWANSLTTPQERDAATAQIRESAPVGIGVVLDTNAEGYPVIRELIPGSTASIGGQLKSGYQIAAVGDGSGRFIEVRGMDLSEVAPLIRGKPGSVVWLQIIQPGGTPANPITVVVPRQQLLFKRPPG